MKHRAGSKTLRWLLSPAVALGLLLPLRAPARAEGIPYIERSWDGSKVVEEKKYCTEYTVIDEDTEHLNGWYVVNGIVESDERLVVDDWAGIILCDGACLTIEEGINVPEGRTLAIYGGDYNSGRLIAEIGDNCNAAIGGDDEQTNGAINIHGGDISAVADVDAAGIGSGDDANAGPINIYGGKVYAKGGSANSDGGAGIGGGGSGSASTINIYGGDVTAQGGANAAGIGGGDEGDGGTIVIYGGTVNATGGSEHTDGGAGIGGGNERSGGNITINGGNVTATGGGNGAGIGGGDNGHSGEININGGTVIASTKNDAAGIGGGCDGYFDRITIRNGTVTATGNNDAGIGGCGIAYDMNSKIRIEGGTVTATGGDNSAGIGGHDEASGNYIDIIGGVVTAQGGSDGAGIGGGYRGESGHIVIMNGTITATGGANGAGIGGGYQGRGYEIFIRDGQITATGGESAAGIGGGNKKDWCEIEITGGTVTATGGSYGAGIGSGDTDFVYNFGEYTPTIKIGGTANVTARGGEEAAGIGGGESFYGGDIIISESATIDATGGHNGAGIGTGDGGFDGGVIKILGGKSITARGGENGAGIGGGDNSPSGTIKISGSDNLTAIGGENAAGIGGGNDQAWDLIEITGGTVNATGGSYGAGIGGGNRDSSTTGGTTTIAGNAVVNAVGGWDAAGIGGGEETTGGKINIFGETVISAQGGAKSAGIGGGYTAASGEVIISDGHITATGGIGGAGIGSGVGCGDSGETVNVSIFGGTVKAIGGGDAANSTKDGSDPVNSVQRGAGIGAGGMEKSESLEAGGTVPVQSRRNDEASCFNGTINFNGGDVTVDQQVGVTSDEALRRSYGTVNFNSSRVHIDTKSASAVMANSIGLNIAEEYVQYMDYDASTPVIVDEGLYTLRFQENKKYIEVIPGYPPQTIEVEDVTVTYGETDKSVSAKSQQGGAISYAVKAGGEEFLAVDASTGALTIRKVPAEGKATVTVTAAAVKGYAETARDVTVTIQAGTMSVTAADVKAAHDGKPHGIVVKVATPASGAKVAYGTKEGTYDQEASPTLTKAGTLTVYYKVTAENYRDFTGHATVTVAAADAETLNRAIEDALNYYDTITDNELYADAAGALKTAIGAAQAAAGEGNLTDTELGEAINAITTALNDAREKVADIDAVQAVEAQIAALPEAAHVKAADWETIRAAWEAYRALTDVQKRQVSAETLAKLEADEAALEKYGPAPETARYIRLTRKGANAAETVAIGERVHVVPQYANDQGWPVIRMTASNRKVADIDPDTGELTLYRAGRVTIRVTAKNQKKSVTASVRVTVEDPTTPTRIGIDQGREIAVSVGKETNCQLTVTAEPAETASADVTWKSSKESVVEVDENGRLTPKKTGKATITAVSKRDKKRKARITVRVVDLTVPIAIRLSTEDGKTTLTEGGTTQLKYELIGADGEVPASSDVTWKSRNARIARVSRDGLVTALRPGAVEIVARTRRGRITGSLMLTVESAASNLENNVTDGAQEDAESVESEGVESESVGPENVVSENVEEVVEDVAVELIEG